MKSKKADKDYRPYKRNLETEKLKKSLKILAMKISKTNAELRHKKKLFSVILWLVTEIDGKYATRYRTGDVLDKKRGKVQHEHVYTRKSLKDEMLANPRRIGKILDRAVACMVTEEEHRELSIKGKGKEGWERYKAAGIFVFDMESKHPKKMKWKDLLDK